MKIYDLFHSLIERFVPMDDPTKLELQKKAKDSYGKVLLDGIEMEAQILSANEFNFVYKDDIEAGKQVAKPLPKLKVEYQAIKFLERWYIRYIIAISFIFLVPWIKNIMNNNSGDRKEKIDEFADYMEWKRYNQDR